MKRKRPPKQTVSEERKHLGTLGDLLANVEIPVVTTVAPRRDVETDIAPALEAKAPVLEKLHIRRERKGRAGKTVTVIDGFEMDDDAVKSLAGRLKRALGCGATVKEGQIVLQGDIAPRARDWLDKNR